MSNLFKDTSINQNIKATKLGIWIKVEGLAYMGTEWIRLKKESTVNIFVIDREATQSTGKPVRIKTPILVAKEEQNEHQRWVLYVPSTLERKIISICRCQVDHSEIVSIKPNAIPALLNLQNIEINGKRVEINAPQLKIFNAINTNNLDAENISAAMGGGKSMIIMWMVTAYPELRPAVVMGKSKEDVNQLRNNFLRLQEHNPELHIPENLVMQQGGGKILNKKQKKSLEEGKGILFMTHSGAHYIPENTELLCVDESHAAVKSKAITSLVNKTSNVKRAYALSGTTGMRSDKAERIIDILMGKVNIKVEHKEFEAIGRVTPVHLHLWHFTGQDPYTHSGHYAVMPGYGHDTRDRVVVRHLGRNRYICDIIAQLPKNETKLVFTPTVKHAVRIMEVYNKELRDKLADGKITQIEFNNEQVYVLHGSGVINSAGEMDSSFQQEYKKKLLAGELKTVISTDFLAVGVDTPNIDHIIDASGQMAKAMNIQRSGRAVRVRDGKVAQIHIICDNHHNEMHMYTKSKVKAMANYYGLLSTKNYLLPATKNPIQHSGITVYYNKTDVSYESANINTLIPALKIYPDSCGWFRKNPYKL